MKAQTNRLTFSQQFFIATMLFGLFFGAGNLIFPIFLGSQAGRNVWPAIVGLLITGVGIPLLGVAAQGISRSNGLQEMAGRVSPRYSIFFTCALYLTIGPFFAIPRCASTSFTVGIEPLLGENVNATVLLAAFSCVFFAAVLFFSLRPGKILTWVGKLLTPLFLLVLAILVVTALLHPTDRIADVTPSAAYAAAPFFAGFSGGLQHHGCSGQSGLRYRGHQRHPGAWASRSPAPSPRTQCSPASSAVFLWAASMWPSPSWGPGATPLPFPAPTAARPSPSSLSTIWGGPGWWCWL